MDDMPPSDVAEWPHFTNLNQHRLVRFASERHPSFEQDVGTRLPREGSLIWAIGCFQKFRPELRFVVRRKQDDHGDSFAESGVKYLPDVWTRPARHLNR